MKYLKALLIPLLFITAILNETLFLKKLRIWSEGVYYVGHAGEMLSKSTEHLAVEYPLPLFCTVLFIGILVGSRGQIAKLIKSPFFSQHSLLEDIANCGSDNSPPLPSAKESSLPNIQNSNPDRLEILEEQGDDANILSGLSGRKKIIMVCILLKYSTSKTIKVCKSNGMLIKQYEIEDMREQMLTWLDDNGNSRITLMQWEKEFEKDKKTSMKRARMPSKNRRGRLG